MTYNNTKILQYMDGMLCRIQARILPEIRWTYEAYADPFIGEPGYLYRISWKGKELNLLCTENSYRQTTQDLILYAFIGGPLYGSSVGGNNE